MIKKTLVVGGLILLVFSVALIFLMLAPGEEVKNDYTPSPVENDENGENNILNNREEMAEVEKILEKIKEVEMIYSATVTNEWGDVLRMRIWEKENLHRIEMEVRGVMAEVYLIDSEAEEYYLYYPTEGSARIIPETAAQRPLQESVIYNMRSISEENLKAVERREVEGEEVIIIEYDKKKLWLDKESKTPFLIEEESEWGEKKTEIEDVSIKELPDHVFRLPENVEMIEHGIF